MSLFKASRLTTTEVHWGQAPMSSHGLFTVTRTLKTVKRRFAIRTGDGLKSPENRMAATLLQPRDDQTPAGAMA